MNGAEFKAIRMRLGLDQARFAAELGYTGKGRNRVMLIEAFESGRKRIPLYIARLAWLVDKVGSGDTVGTSVEPLSRAYIISWPQWPGYTREELDDAAK